MSAAETTQHVHGGTDVGRERDHNEDRHTILRLPDGAWLLIVCDGMGGHEAGEVASAVAVAKLEEVLGGGVGEDPPAALRSALVAANDAVLDEADRGGHPTMGTTAVVAVVRGDQYWYAWVGDSRFYHFRRGELIARSIDHTHVQRMVEAGLLSEDEARYHPDASVLTQALGGGRLAQVDFQPSVPETPGRLEEGDVLLLCSDGLYDLLDHHDIYARIAGREAEDAPRALIEAANARGGHDNISAAVLVYGSSRIPALPGGDQDIDVEVSADSDSDVEPPPGPRQRAPLRSALLRYALPFAVGLLAGVVIGRVLRVAAGDPSWSSSAERGAAP